MDEQAIETWRIHNRLLRGWLNAVPPEHLAIASTSRERRVGDHFAHIHNNRLDWLKPAASALCEGIGKVQKGDAINPVALGQALAQSEEAVSALLAQSRERGGKIKAFKPHASAFLGYLLVHEGYHLGKIDALLRQAGHAPDDKTHYALWQWSPELTE